MHKYKKLGGLVLLTGFFFIIYILFLIYFYYSGPEEEDTLNAIDEITVEKEGRTPDIVISPFIRDNLQGMQIRYSVNASEGRLYSEYGPSGTITGQRIEITDIKEIKINTRKETPLTIRADKAVIQNRRNQTDSIVLHDNIIIRHESIGEIDTQYLSFTFHDNVIRTDEHFFMQDDSAFFEGKGFEFEIDSGQLRVLRGLKAGFRPREDNPPVFLAGESILYTDEEKVLRTDDRTAFLFDQNWLRADNTEILLDDEKRLERIDFQGDIEAEFPFENEKYLLLAEKLSILFKEGEITEILMNGDFLLEHSPDDLFIRGSSGTIKLSNTGRSSIGKASFDRFFYLSRQELGISAFSGYLDHTKREFYSEHYPVLFTGEYTTSAGSIRINYEGDRLNAYNTVHTIMPGNEDGNNDRIDVHSDILDYCLKDGIINYQKNCKILTDRLTISSNDIKLYKDTQNVYITESVKGEILHYDPALPTGERFFIDTEYMHYDAEEEVIFLKEISNIYPVIWQEGFRASSKNIIIKPREEYTFFTEDVYTLFYRDFYDPAGTSGFSIGPQEQPMEIVSESLEVFHAENYARYSRDVFLRQGENTLSTDIMDIFLDMNMLVERIVFYNNIKIAFADIYIEGEEGVYYPDTGEFHISNNVSLRDSHTNMQNASRLIYYTLDGRFAVFGTDIITKHDLQEAFEVPRIFPERRSNIWGQ